MGQRSMWECKARYADGTKVERLIPYDEKGKYKPKSERQYELECWLLGQHEDCVWYSVDYIEEV